MDCERASILIMEYIDKNISSEDKEELFMHLENCHHCSLEFSLLLEATELTEEIEEVNPPEEIEDMVMKSIDLGKYKEKSRIKYYAIGILVCLMIIGGFMGYRLINSYGSLQDVIINLLVKFVSFMAITTPKIVSFTQANFLLIFSISLGLLLAISTSLIVLAIAEVYIVKRWKLNFRRN